MSESEKRTCPCGSTDFVLGPRDWYHGGFLVLCYCPTCGAELNHDGTTGPTADALAEAYQDLLRACAGRPQDHGLDAPTWADAARQDATR